MKYYIAKFCKDYADEFDVVGLSVINDEQYEDILSKIKTFDEYCDTANLVEWEVYFGSNESLTFGANEHLANYVDFIEIDDLTYYTMLEVLGKFGFGFTIQVIIAQIADQIPDEQEDAEYYCPDCGQPLSEDEWRYCYCDSCGATDINVELSKTLDSLATAFIFKK